MPRQQEWRDLFIAPEGYRLVTVDYGQIEIRIIAEFTRDDTLLRILGEGGDLHAKTAATIFNVPVGEVTKEQRGLAKAINFGLSYGMGPKGLAEQVGISLSEAKRFIAGYSQAYPKVKPGLDRLGYKAAAKGHSCTPLGRKRFFDPRDAQHLGRNTPIQATCGDILKKAIQYLHDELEGLDASIVNLIHDEVLVEAKAEVTDQVAGIVQTCMKRAGADFLENRARRGGCPDRRQMEEMKMLIMTIDKYLQERPRDERLKNCFHPSSLHKPARELYRQYLHGDTSGDFDSRTLRIFDNGHAVHNRIQGYLAEVGILRQGEVAIQNKEYEICGHADGIVELEGMQGVLEIKSMNASTFYSCHEPKPEHLVQLNVYMFCLDIPRGCLLYECKDDQRLKEFYVKMDPIILDPVLKKIRYVQACLGKGIEPEVGRLHL